MAHTLRTLLRPAAAVALAGSVGLAQAGAPAQQRFVGQRVDVPPLSERINITPVQEGPGAFGKTRMTRKSRVLGIVINEVGFIVPSAGLILVRNLEDGDVAGHTPVDGFGQFDVPGIDPGLYAAELVDEKGEVITSSPSFTVGVDEIVRVTPVIPHRSIGGFAALLRSGTAGAIYAAASVGVLAIDTRAPISP